MPRLPDAGLFWHSKTVAARSRQLRVIYYFALVKGKLPADLLVI
jgi:hypothetical protein